MFPTSQPERSPRTRISFLVPNIGGSSMGFAIAYARALADDHEVKVVGTDFWGGGVMPMYRDAFDYTVVPAPRLYRLPDYLWQIRRLCRAATGDILFAIKAMPQTVVAALREKRRRGCQVVVCLDEWDGALMARRTPADRRAYWRRHWMHPLEENYYLWVERLLPRADLVVSTSSFLQRKFGGIVVRMGVDTDRFRPLGADEKRAVRTELGLASPVPRGGVWRGGAAVAARVGAAGRLPAAGPGVAGGEHVRSRGLELRAGPRQRAHGRRLGRPVLPGVGPGRGMAGQDESRTSARGASASFEHRKSRRTLWLRPFVVYGPGQGGNMVIPYAVRCATEWLKAELTEGLQRRDFIHVDDVADGIAQLALCRADADGFFAVCNLGRGEFVRVRDVLERIAERMDARQWFRFGAWSLRPNEPQEPYAEVLAAKMRGWRAQIPWEQGIDDLCRELGKENRG